MKFNLLFALTFLPSTQGFTPVSRGVAHSSNFVLSLAKKKKGFGNVDDNSGRPAAPKVTTTSAGPAKVEEQTAPATTPNAGQLALEELRRERAEKRNEELRKIREIQETDKQLQEAPAAIPDQVAQRMGARMLSFVGIPLFLGMGSFVFFWYMATYRDMEFQPALVAITTALLMAAGLVGITYSIMSASWDPDREGSLLGTEEFQRNVESVKSGLGRSKENVLLRERMAKLSDEDIKAMRELERKEAAEEKRTQSLQSKLNDELE